MERLQSYFRSNEALYRTVDFITFGVGGREHCIELRARGFKTGVRFEVPRHSLMQAIENECFDDLLIGNFMRTCLIGKWPIYGLYPDFSPYVAKYADNGRAKTAEQLRAYFREYRKRAPAEYAGHRLEVWAFNHVRRHVSPNSLLNTARGAFKWAFEKF